MVSHVNNISGVVLVESPWDLQRWVPCGRVRATCHADLGARRVELETVNYGLATGI